jgi:radical SAM superfamily enzyme YgiQ (UPF0313 family)
MARLLLVVFDHTIYHYRGTYVTVATISALARQHGHLTDAIIIKQTPGAKQALIDKILRFGPDVVGFSVMSGDIAFARELARAVKSTTSALVLFGGIHVTIHPQEVISAPQVDMICVGEGEHPTLELLDALDSDQRYAEIRNLWVKAEGTVFKNEPRPLNELDQLPVPDASLFHEPGRRMTYVTLVSAGCPFECSYCHNHILKRRYRGLGPYVRRKSVEKVIGELLEITGAYRVERVNFLDDIFTQSRSWVLDFCQRYRARIGVPFWCTSRVEQIDRELVGALKDAGCVRIRFGIESGDERIRERILRRRMSNREIVEKLAIAREAGLEIETFFMVGIPGEGPRELRRSYELARRLRPDVLGVSTIVPYRGTQIWELCRERELIAEGDTPATFNTPHSSINYPREHRRAIERTYKKLTDLNTYRKYETLKRHRFLAPLYEMMKLVVSDYEMETTLYRLADLWNRLLAGGSR